LQLIRELTGEVGWENWYLQVRGMRQTNAPVLFGPKEFPKRWVAKEGDLSFEFRTDNGLSPGLFLDQRQNRHWVRRHAAGLRVLNLFCYTGGFSVASAVGGAKTVVSVDVSKNFLEWAKVNFELNSQSMAPGGTFEFRAIDSREYLAWAKKKNLFFDLVICDPPSFSRSKSGVFSIDQDFDELLLALFAVTQKNGRILLATNYEKWNQEALRERSARVLAKNRLNVLIDRTPGTDWDFELPSEPHNMKSIFIQKI
jgi:23S rRNA (cytosine1962-C5)-methyltransferase